MKIIVDDGTKSETFSTDSGIDELETKSYTLNYEGLVKKISIAPVFDSSGKEKLGNVADEVEYSNKEVMKNHGAIAWWRFEGGAKDSVGRHDGTLRGDVNCDVQGKFGKGCEFDGIVGGNIDAIEIVDSMNSPNFAVGSEGFTYSAWINVEGDPGGAHNLIMGSGYPWFSVRKNIGNKLQFAIELSDGSKPELNGDTTLDTGRWYHVVALFDKDLNMELYLNGDWEYSEYQGLSADSMLDTENNQYIGNWHHTLNQVFNGIIDEPMIFNRGLTADEVESLYNLDLG